jgi:DNA-binding XRE family transcriptional regulator
MTSPLCAFRRRHCLTQAEAAAAVGVGLSTWRQLEREWQGRRPSPQFLAHLAALDALTKHHLKWPEPARSTHVDDDQG